MSSWCCSLFGFNTPSLRLRGRNATPFQKFQHQLGHSHDEDEDDHGRPLLIDSHGAEIVDPVWALLDHTLAVAGPRPLLIEWDNDVPDWPVLAAEAQRGVDALAKQSVMA